MPVKAPFFEAVSCASVVSPQTKQYNFHGFYIGIHRLYLLGQLRKLLTRTGLNPLMRLIRKFLVIVLINFFIFLFLISAVVLLPPAISDVLKLAIGSENEEEKDPRAFLPIYKNHSWVETHFVEFNKIATVYYDFIGWRRDEFHGETITVDKDGYRRHDGISASSYNESSIWMFGGSAMWGTGVKDSFTIPAYVQEYSAKSVFNFGESGYTAHQSLNLLIKAYLTSGMPEHVFFYDGVNEAAHKCRSELSFYSASQEYRIRSKLEKTEGEKSNLIKVFSPTLDILSKFLSSTISNANADASELYNCHTDREKTRLIAQSLILDWSMAKKLVEENGGKFHAILQPVSFIGDPNLSHLKLEDNLFREQFKVVYQEIMRQLDEEEFKYTDLTGIFDGDDLLYIDFCHVIPEGNAKVARKISEELI